MLVRVAALAKEVVRMTPAREMARDYKEGKGGAAVLTKYSGYQVRITFFGGAMNYICICIFVQ